MIPSLPTGTGAPLIHSTCCGVVPSSMPADVVPLSGDALRGAVDPQGVVAWPDVVRLVPRAELELAEMPEGCDVLRPQAHVLGPGGDRLVDLAVLLEGVR